ncbi:MAG: hypothetical protein GY931_08405 [Maribacter sp.]|nr:hypothetical protein [Maribacter sp.]
MKTNHSQQVKTKTETLLAVLEWIGLVGCLLGIVVVGTSHYALVSGLSDVFGFQPANVRNMSVVNVWLLPGLVVMVGAHLSRRLVRRQSNE